MHELIKPIQYCDCKTSRNVTMVFLVFNSNNEIEETLKDLKLTKIAPDMHELISSMHLRQKEVVAIVLELKGCTKTSKKVRN